MARATKIVCLYCEAKHDAGVPFCPSCDRPTEWASHEERVAWEVAQWRTSHDGAKSNGRAVHAPPPPTPRRARPKPQQADLIVKPEKPTKRRILGRAKRKGEVDAAKPQPEAAPSKSPSPPAEPVRVVRMPDVEQPATSNGNGAAEVRGRQRKHMAAWELEAIERRAQARKEPPEPRQADPAVSAPKAETPEPRTVPQAATGEPVALPKDEEPATKLVEPQGPAEQAEHEATVDAPGPAAPVVELDAAKKKTAKKPAAKRKTAKKPAARKPAAKKPAAKTPAATEAVGARTPGLPDETLLRETVEILKGLGEQMGRLNDRMEKVDERLEQRISALEASVVERKRRSFFRRG